MLIRGYQAQDKLAGREISDFVTEQSIIDKFKVSRKCPNCGDGMWFNKCALRASISNMSTIEQRCMPLRKKLHWCAWSAIKLLAIINGAGQDTTRTVCWSWDRTSRLVRIHAEFEARRRVASKKHIDPNAKNLDIAQVRKNIKNQDFRKITAPHIIMLSDWY
jgi:hypothetical protein